MTERKEPGLNLSGLDMDEREAVTRQAASSRTPAHPAPQAADKRGGGSLLQTFILLLLAAACAGLGYWSVGLKQTLDQQQAVLEKTQQRLASVEQTLALTSSSATQSGQTLMGRISQLESQASDKYSHFDSEIAKLWTVAYQRNKPQLEEQKKQLDAQTSELSALKKQLAETEKALAKSDKRLSGLATDMKQVTTLQQNLAALSKQLASDSERVKKLSADADFALSLERDDRTKAQQALQGRLDKLEKAQSGGGLTQRVANIEQSIRAIDGSRRQFSQDLLHVRQQVNNLQLKVERALGG